jgi:hypothetical protein
MTPDQSFGQVPASKLELERKCELVRQRYCPHLPSRFQAFFGLATLEEAVAFRNATRAETGIAGSIWEVEAGRVFHRGDMRLLTAGRSTEANLRAYWNGAPLDGTDPVWECLALLPVTAIRCVIAEDE